MNTRLSKQKNKWLVNPLHRNRYLGAMLITLHGAVLSVNVTGTFMLFILVHAAMFLLWQPVWSGQARIGIRVIFFLIVAVALLPIETFQPWFLAFWALFLLGLLGGETIVSRSEQFTAILAFITLALSMLLYIAPLLAGVPALESDANWITMVIVPAIASPLLFINASKQGKSRIHMDIVRALIAPLVVSVLSLASLVYKYSADIPYPDALIKTTLISAVVLLALAWLWGTDSRLSRMREMLSRYLLNLGLSFESWLKTVAEVASEQISTPVEFLDRTTSSLLELPWVSGAGWNYRGKSAIHGEPTKHVVSYSGSTCTLDIYTRMPVGPALRAHAQLLFDVMRLMLEAKERELELAMQERLISVHETGAKLTHDIKNILQSIQALAEVARSADFANDQEAPQVLRLQLVRLTDRLKATLNKLKVPPEGKQSSSINLNRWWEATRARYIGLDIEFIDEISDTDMTVPGDVLDGILDNLISNAQHKRIEQGHLGIQVTLKAKDSQLQINVCDNGPAMDDEVAERIFRNPVRSESGLGVGLYLSARMATNAGYTLRLASNEPGRVCFKISQ
ncbi:MAG: hypothetical protein BMS9Abin15_0984 [Gammaproteobacteria bacterium]|nr:MAG: hypothetical protein BMS9Abin15_0984 [Gammaproteobacteria bacterium]